MPVKLPPRSRPLLRRYIRKPYLTAARTSPAARKWLDRHGYITPHFSWESYACRDAQHTPVPKKLRANAIRLHWKLELFKHRLGDVPVVVDGPYRTEAHNRRVGGARNSRHTFADGADFFAAQVDRWIRDSAKLKSRADVIRVAERTFPDGGVGNENTGTLHLDARGWKARFVTWVASR